MFPRAWHWCPHLQLRAWDATNGMLQTETMSTRQLMLQAEWWQSCYYGQGSAAPPAPWDRKLTETRIRTPQGWSGHGDITHWELLPGVKRILTPTNMSLIRLRVKNSIGMREKPNHSWKVNHLHATCTKNEVLQSRVIWRNKGNLPISSWPWILKV